MKNNNNNGSSLVEVLVSLLLLTIVLTGGMGFYFYSQEEMTLALHKKIAMELANSKLEDIKSKGYSVLPNPATPPGVVTQDDVEIGSLLTNAADNLGSKVTVMDIDDPENGVTDYKEVKVEVKWKESGKISERAVALVTYMAP